jgi:SEC-C motif-containing protein
MCPCGSGQAAEACCVPLHRGERAPTAEALMRSRYSAYALGEVDYVINTHEPATRGEIDRDSTEAWANQADWQGLEIVATEGGGEGDDEGIVEFIARYHLKGQDLAHHERSRFRKEEGVWYYVDGDMVKAKPIVRERPKVGRNEPCPCGSGKKFKKCHGLEN